MSKISPKVVFIMLHAFTLHVCKLSKQIQKYEKQLAQYYVTKYTLMGPVSPVWFNVYIISRFG